MIKCGGCGIQAKTWEEFWAVCDDECCAYCGFSDEECECDDEFIDSVDFS